MRGIQPFLSHFTAFEGHDPNPSWAIAKGTAEAWKERHDPNLRVECVEVPILWHGAYPVLRNKVSECNPDYLVCMGYFDGLSYAPELFAAKGPGMCMEMLARNEAIHMTDDDGKYYDPKQAETGETVPIDPSLPNTYSTLLPASRFQDRYPEVFTTSDDAGGYLCNFVFFMSMGHFPEIKQKGFIHVGGSEQTIADGIQVLTDYAEWLAEMELAV